jgi:hypothetical protein
MPHLDHTGPKATAPKQTGKPGESLAERRNSGGNTGKGKRIKNN